MNIQLKNTRKQSVKVSMRDASGKLVELNLEPYATSAVLDEKHLDVHARQLVGQGVLKVRKVVSK
jgi:hypothetical protein